MPKNDPAESAFIRDKPIWICTNCGNKIWARDVSLNIVLGSHRFKGVHCPECLHVDEPLKERTYGLPVQKLLKRLEN